MGLFSFLRKNQQDSSTGKSDFYSQADEEKPARGKRKQGNRREEPVDPVLPEKKRARRRLVGAIALVLAAIIGLPMILDSEPRQLPDDIDIQIPSKDTPAPAAQAKAGLVAKADSAAATAPSNSLSAEEEIVEPGPAAPVAAPAAAKDTPKETPKETVKAESKPAEAEKKPQVASAKPEAAEPKATPHAPSVSKADEAARARAILEGKPVPSAAPHASGKVVLQVAALASQDKVNELQKKLQAAGLKSHTQKVATASGERIRVRIGPFANEAEADKARAKLTKIGLTGKSFPA
ncbi:SPOR domain-containing protein [Herminiimonas contaminans]|uniref:SPOR domain-containing protein n=1 Tax=Herminiimonas contaminans TaxID=1111140 RepID=A0ABS0EP35_9BURK|nr:SPOR domain-containing protein [Herminiimonas contaminans]MBF8176611.1 SPOR domain-containing protein [Herminiimonas contaminans]